MRGKKFDPRCRMGLWGVIGSLCDGFLVASQVGAREIQLSVTLPSMHEVLDSVLSIEEREKHTD
jgi:hypothetical protein